MNISFFIGKIVNKINFNFFLDNKKHISIATFEIKLDNGTIITVKTYDNTADFVYRNLRQNMIILVSGSISDNLILDVKDICFI